MAGSGRGCGAGTALGGWEKRHITATTAYHVHLLVLQHQAASYNDKSWFYVVVEHCPV